MTTTPPDDAHRAHALKVRYEDPDVLRDALLDQELVCHDREVVARILGDGEHPPELREFATGAVVIDAELDDRDLHFILAGRVDVRVRGNLVAERSEREHVGEMACIEPGAQRSATCRAVRPTVTLALAPERFRKIANEFPAVWERIARTLGKRLRQRGDRERAANAKPHIFLGSSSEALATLTALETALKSNDYELVPWVDVFRPGRYTLEQLSDRAFRSDFAVLLLTADDVTESRGEESASARDNVILELGLFIARLSPARVFVISDENVKIPTDLCGWTRLNHKAEASQGERGSIGYLVGEIRRQVGELGVRFAGLGGERP